MKKNKRSTGLKTKILVSTLIPIVISYLLINTVAFAVLFNSLREATEAEFFRIGQQYAADFEEKIHVATDYLSIASSILEMSVEVGITNRQIARDVIFHAFDSYGQLDGSSLYFEPNAFDGRDAEYIGTEFGTEKSGRISYYFYMDDGKTAYLPEALPDDVEFELPHYTKAKEANRPIYTEPVVYEVMGREIPMFTLTEPIQSAEGAFIGAVTVDLFLEELYEHLQNQKIYETGYILIVNDQNQIVYSPRFEDIGKTRDEIGLSYALPDGESVVSDAKSLLTGEDTLIAIQSIYIPHLDSHFYISVCAPTSEIYSEGTQMAVVLVLFNLIVVLSIAGLIYFLIARISKPINDITQSLDKIAGGKYDARISGEYDGEFAVVKDSVNAMADSIEAYIKEAHDSLEILKSIMDGLDAYIYVTDPSTDRILFVNEQMRKHFNFTGDGVGQHCYEVLQEGMTERCEFCPCYQLDKEPDAVIEWEEQNTVTKRFYSSSDRYIDWIGGTKVHLQHSVDITDMKMAMDGRLEAERKALELERDKDKAEAAAQAKNDFLARMSHEIRTPMNAVMGMSELILRKKLPPDIYENALGIKSASNNLLSIINDILDFSKIESGRMEIIETDYMLPSLMNDIIGIIRIRLMEKPVQFSVFIDSAVPAALVGDEIRIRQVLLNLMSNAVKYTPKGHVSMDVSGEMDGDTVTLRVAIADSGVGVKEEDMEKLFGDFSRIDVEQNKGIEGTGLGLAISRNLCRAMGGDITVASEYGKGSAFTALLPQKVKQYTPFAAVDDPEGSQVLLYETRNVYKQSISRAFENLGVAYNSVETIPELFENLEKYPYVFISSFAYGSIAPVISKLEKPPCLVLLADVTDMNAPKNARILSLPAHSLSVANILNDIAEDSEGVPSAGGASFTAHDARVLIVDDITANLKVAEGLLAPYEMQIDICKSGMEAIELVSKNKYDLVFMDHMMPEMDGIEAVARIRGLEGEYFKALPIVALTANAVSGVREMFVQNGMNDFLAKPIETVKLDSILEKWIPKDKRSKLKPQKQQEESSAFIEMLMGVSGLDVEKALSVVGGSTDSYERIVKLSVRLLTENITRLNELIETDLPGYAIEVHGIKGVLNNIGAYALGEMALELELMSKDGEWEKCKTLHLPFMEQLESFRVEATELISSITQSGKEKGDKAQLAEALPDIEEAAELFDSIRALELISEIEAFSFGKKTDDALEKIKHAFESFDFEEAIRKINELKNEVDNNEQR